MFTIDIKADINGLANNKYIKQKREINMNYQLTVQNNAVFEGDTRDEVISRASDYYQDLTEESGCVECKITTYSDDDEELSVENYTLSWSNFEISDREQHGTLDKSTQGVE